MDFLPVDSHTVSIDSKLFCVVFYTTFDFSSISIWASIFLLLDPLLSLDPSAVSPMKSKGSNNIVAGSGTPGARIFFNGLSLRTGTGGKI